MNLKEKYADLIVRSGLNVQKDQIVVIRANVEMNDFVRLIVKSCFDVGAKDVIVRYSDDEINRMRYLSGNRTPYDYEALFHNETAEKGNLKAYGSILQKEEEKGLMKLKPITNEKEWKVIEMALKVLQEEAGNNKWKN